MEKGRGFRRTDQEALGFPQAGQTIERRGPLGGEGSTGGRGPAARSVGRRSVVSRAGTGGGRCAAGTVGQGEVPQAAAVRRGARESTRTGRPGDGGPASAPGGRAGGADQAARGASASPHVSGGHVACSGASGWSARDARAPAARRSGGSHGGAMVRPTAAGGGVALRTRPMEHHPPPRSNPSPSRRRPLRLSRRYGDAVGAGALDSGATYWREGVGGIGKARLSGECTRRARSRAPRLGVSWTGCSNACGSCQVFSSFCRTLGSPSPARCLLYWIRRETRRWKSA